PALRGYSADTRPPLSPSLPRSTTGNPSETTPHRGYSTDTTTPLSRSIPGATIGNPSETTPHRGYSTDTTTPLSRSIPGARIRNPSRTPEATSPADPRHPSGRGTSGGSNAQFSSFGNVSR